MSKRILVYIGRAVEDPKWLLAKMRLLLMSSPLIKIKEKALKKKHKQKSENIKKEPNLLVCVYDLERLPITFNVTEYLCLYSSIAITQKKNFFVVILDQQVNKQITKGSFAEAYSVENREYRLRNLIAPATGLYPACVGFSILKSRELFYSMYEGYDIYPPEFSPTYLKSAAINMYDEKLPFVGLGKKFASIKTTSFARKLAAKIIELKDKDRLITITLRRSKYDPKRNSDLNEWEKFSNYAIGKGYRVVVMPDAENPSEFEPISRELIYTTFVYNIELRAAVYEISECNLGVSNGPLALSYFNADVNSTIAIKNAPSGSEDEAIYKTSGVNPNDPYFWYNDLTYNSSLDDTFLNIKKLFESVMSI